MLVDSERDLLIFYRSQFDRESCGHATQEVQLVFVHSDCVQRLSQDVAQFDNAKLLRLDGFLVLD
jgi:hypothetical protein